MISKTLLGRVVSALILSLFSCASLFAASGPSSVILSGALMKTETGVPLVTAILESGTPIKILGTPESTRALNNWAQRNRLGTHQVEVIEVPAPWGGTLWARDWTPIENGNKAHFFSYNKSVGWIPDSLRPSTALIKEAWAQAGLITPVATHGLSLEGGNFFRLSDGHCFSTARVLFMNEIKTADREDYLNGVFPQNMLDLVKQEYSHVGCKKVTIFPLKPFDPIQHVDMWMKPLGKGIILVASISDESIELLYKNVANGNAAIYELPENSKRGDVITVNVTVKKYLDDRAKQLQAMGYKVVRVPSPAQGLTRPSYVNGLVLGNTFLAPFYDPTKVESAEMKYPDASLFETQRQEFASILNSLGLKVRWIPADEIIAQGGAIHCVTKDY